MTSPVIGVCAALERARWAVWDLPAALAPMNYIEHVQNAGGTAFIIPPDPALVHAPDRVLDHIDGLLLLGGPDIGAAHFGAQPHPEADPPVDLRDEVELALVAEACRRHMPLLGICRGMQLLNIAHGGTLVQHLPESHNTEEHRRRTGYFEGNEHGITAAAGSRVARAEGEHPAVVASHHHQAIDRLGEGLLVTASAADGIVEAVEVEGEAWQVGVQWHPEPDPGSRIIEALVEAARAALAGRAA